MLAGAAAATAASAALAPPAVAADGDPVELGADTNAADQSTRITIGGPNGIPGAATLDLRNADGPSLRLQPLADDWAGSLQPGEIANTTAGLLVGLAAPAGQSYVVTGQDLDLLPIPYAIGPLRILDTRTTAGRANVVASSIPSWLDGSGRVKAGAWIDLAVENADAAFPVAAAFLNLTVTRGVSAGYVRVYPPGPPTPTSTLNFTAGATLANAAFVQTAVVGDTFAVRIYVSAAATVVADLTGLSLLGSSAGADDIVAARADPEVRRARQRPAARRVFRAITRHANRGSR